ncbi:unnamed protein product, partial [Symbiodinium pilosum]
MKEPSKKMDAAAEVETWSVEMEEDPRDGTTGAAGFAESLTRETLGSSIPDSTDPMFFKKWPGETEEQNTQRLLGLELHKSCAEEASFDFDMDCEERCHGSVAFGGVDDQPLLRTDNSLG